MHERRRSITSRRPPARSLMSTGCARSPPLSAVSSLVIMGRRTACGWRDRQGLSRHSSSFSTGKKGLSGALQLGGSGLLFATCSYGEGVPVPLEQGANVGLCPCSNCRRGALSRRTFHVREQASIAVLEGPEIARMSSLRRRRATRAEKSPTRGITRWVRVWLAPMQVGGHASSRMDICAPRSRERPAQIISASSECRASPCGSPQTPACLAGARLSWSSGGVACCVVDLQRAWDSVQVGNALVERRFSRRTGEENDQRPGACR